MRGSTYKRKLRDGTLTYGVVFDDLPGADKKRKQRRIGGFATKKEAVQKLHDIRTAMQSGGFHEPTKLTVSEYGDKWLSEVAHYVRPRTYVGYRDRLRDYVYPHVGHMPMWAVRPQHMKDMYDKLLREGRKRKQKERTGLHPRSVLHVHRISHAMFAEAVRSDVVQSNPCASVKPPRVPRIEQRVLNEAEVQRLLKASEDSPLHAFVVTAVATGARAGELASLKWPDVDLERGQVHIAFGQAKDGSRSELKTPRSRRHIVLPPFALSVLKAYKAKRKLASDQPWSEDSFVFVDALGRPLLVASISGDFRVILKSTGLGNDVHPHMLRHTFASIALKAGVPVTTVSANLGHNNTATTLNVYAHHIPSTEDAVAQVMQRAISNVP